VLWGFGEGCGVGTGTSAAIVSMNSTGIPVC